MKIKFHETSMIKIMNKTILIFILLIIFFFSTGYSQKHSVKGKVVDSETLAPLAFVNIIYNEKHHGTTTGIDGEFLVTTGKPVEFLSFSYLGYESLTITINQISEDSSLNIMLKSKALELEEVVVFPGVNPAHRIINEAINNKDINDPDKLSSYSYRSYNKMVFTVDMGEDSVVLETPQDAETVWIKKINELLKKQDLLLIESLSNKEFLFPDKYKEEIIASRVSGLKDPSFILLATQFQSFSFYKNLIRILDKNYINPISRGSIKQYLFILEDTLYTESSDTVFVISYKPRKGKSFDGLKGLLHINTNKYAVQSVIAQPDKDLDRTIKIQQKYEFIDNKHWFPVQLNSDIIFNNFKAKFTGQDSTNINSPVPVSFNKTIIGIGKSYINNIKLDPPLNKKDFNNVSIIVNRDTYDKSGNFWAEKRFFPLTKKDSLTYRVIDSIGIATNLDRKLKSFEMITTGYLPVKYFDLDLRKLVSYNGHEGFRPGVSIRTSEKLSRFFTIGGYLAHGIKDKKTKYGAEINLNIHKLSGLKLGYSWYDDLQESGSYKFYNNSSLRNTEFLRAYLVENMDRVINNEVFIELTPMSYLKGQVFLRKQIKTGLSEYRFNNQDNNKFNFTELGVSLMYSHKESFMRTLYDKISLGTKYPVLRVNLIKGIGLLDGDYKYFKITGHLSKSFNTRKFGQTNITLTGGFIDNNIPLTNIFNGHGSYKQFTIETANSFATMRIAEFYSDRFINIFFKQNFGSVLINTKNFHPEFVFVTNAGWGKLDKADNHLNIDVRSFDKGYFESGILINNLINMSGLVKYGLGIFYRYGPYSFDRIADNFAYKFTMSF